MHQSMTGFASAQGHHGAYSWVWDLRSVNARGLDVRVRLPDWLPGLDAALKARLGKRIARGNVTLGLRVTRSEETAALAVNPAALDQVLIAMAQVEDRAMQQGLSLAPSRAADILSQRGVLETAAVEEDAEALTEALLADFDTLARAFVAMREGEGAALARLLTDQLARIEDLVAQAGAVLGTRREAMQEALQAQLRRVLEADVAVDQQRLEQELALIAVKADVTEELDRLTAHVAAARGILESGGPAGRKLDFLAQEFNREANTLCSKSQNADLTAVGLDLKAVIEQMREQVQNLE
ncbi:yicC family protein [Pseudooceanicola batsensis HTCC2597]|uniref:YicC family protein n=1 Tax=Pseudooceanicola batsensis (strain ATCC BAA-863 / DSM 15984 / KCTC 12145 / HTCC2597) TaxID=252305 RepID=A3TXP3_PSEBH|nr:YicC/YloC family endoribonuclease [Pseudooceanicola batsensis]EAQ03603.1 yicC family protein [Pseudooceanicola batsensis HTCC2597]